MIVIVLSCPKVGCISFLVQKFGSIFAPTEKKGKKKAPR